MTLHPEIQKKAQAEIDMVVGSDRLPEFTDREQLPYVNAVVSYVIWLKLKGHLESLTFGFWHASEVLRWYPIGPLGTLDQLIYVKWIARH